MEVQAEKEQKVAPAEPAAKEEKKVVLEFFEPIELLPMITVAQNQNGLRHKDYQRYQSYCSRKLRKLRCTLKLTQGRTREFIKKEITPEVAINSKVLLIKVFEVERYWAYAMHLKQKVSQSIMDTKRTQKEMKDKFKQAATSAAELLSLCKLKLGTDNTVFEAEAYSLFLQGQALVENEKPGEAEKTFKEALKCMHKANELYAMLKKGKDPITQILYKEKMDQIEPFIRLALFKMGTDAEKNKKYFEEAKTEVVSEIKKQMETIQKAKDIKIKENYIEIHYGGKTVPLNTEQLQILYKGITKQLEDAETAKTNQEKVKEYSKLLGIIGKWMEEVKREKAEEFKKSEGSAQLYNTLIDYTNGLKADIVIKKLQLIVSDLKDKFDTETDLTMLIRKRKNPKESAAVGKIVMLFVNIPKKVKQIKNLEKDFSDHKRIAGYEMQERIYKLLLLYYKAIYYAINGKLLEAHYIAQSVIEEAKKAEEYQKVNATDIVSKDKFFDEAMGIGAKAKRLRGLAHCAYIMRETKKTTKEVETVEAKKARRAIKYKDAVKLIEEDAASTTKLNSWTADLSSAPKDLIAKKPKERKAKMPELAGALTLSNNPKKIRIVNDLPAMKSLHVKPYLHNIAESLIEFPDLEATIKEIKEKKTGLFSKIKWLFGR